jgi:hypothetical protein
MPVLIVCFVIAWVIMKGFRRVASNTRGEVGSWWARAETRAHQWRHHPSSARTRVAGIAAGLALWTGRTAYRTARFGVRSFAEGVREGWATRHQAAAHADRWGRAAWSAITRRRRPRPSRLEPDPKSRPESEPRPDAPPASAEADPEPTEPDTKPDDGQAPLIVMDGEAEPDPPDSTPNRVEDLNEPDLIVDFIQPQPGDLDGLRPADVSYRPHPQPQSGGLMTVPQQSNVGVGEVTGIDSTRIQLAAVSRVLSATSEALEHMQAGLAEYNVDERTIGEVAQLADQVQAASSAATTAVTNINARHGGVEDAIKSAPVRAAQTRYYEE